MKMNRIIAAGSILIFVGEENLNVSAILESGKYTELRTLDGTRTIPAINGIIAAVPAVYGGNYPYELQFILPMY